MSRSGPDPIRVLIVDDEQVSRDHLRTRLARTSDMVIVGECRNGVEALNAISELQPELVFLDVQMPDLDGIGVVEALDEVTCPEIVFVTGYAEYMERALQLHAVDYLLKPYSEERFQSALAHARRRVLGNRAVQGQAEAVARYRALLAVAAETARERPLDVRYPAWDRTKRRWLLVDTREIDYVEAAGTSASEAHGRMGTLTWDRPIAKLAEELRPRGFIRVHRCCLVNTANVREVKDRTKGEYTLFFAGNRIVDTGRTYREEVERAFGLEREIARPRSR